MIRKYLDMIKNDYISIFNAMIRGTPVSFQEKLFPMVSEYLTEINYDKILIVDIFIVENIRFSNNK